MPAVGIAMAGTTLVGHSIGAGDRAWARRVGNTIIRLCMGYMGCVGLFLGLAGPWLIPLFVPATDAHAAEVVRVGVLVIWIAAAYQLFDGLNLGSGFCLRGAGDANVPAILVLVLSWFLFVPLAHMLSFEPGQGWVEGLPQFGLGAVGGWLAALTYIFALAIALALRWRSGAWERIRVR
jgi:MATE family multidrug resistance protein